MRVVATAVVPRLYVGGMRMPPWFHCGAPAVCAASEARPSEDHARRQLARTGWA